MRSAYQLVSFIVFLFSFYRALLDRIWHVVELIAQSIGADIYDWGSILHSPAAHAACLAHDGVHPSMQVEPSQCSSLFAVFQST